MNESWLAHHGILGQKWGIRRFQNEDGSLTPAGEKRYGVNIDSAKQKLNDAKNSIKIAQTQTKKLKAQKEYKWAKEDLKNEQIKEKLNNEKNISEHRKKLQAQYKKQGMSEEEAAIAAYKRARTEKILAVAGVMTVAAVGTYVAAKHLDKYTDKIINKNIVLHNISGDANKGVEDAFYAAFKGSDRLKYRGVFGSTVKNKYGQVIDTSMNLKDSMKVASEKSGSKVLKELMEKDPELRKDVEDQIKSMKVGLIFGGNDKQRAMMDKAELSLLKGQMDDNVFKAVNFGLVDHSERGQRISKKFYGALKEKGYDAITDINDKHLSGYNAKAPIIVFNGKAKVESIAHQKLDNNKMDIDRGKAMVLNTITQSLKDPGNLATIGVIGAGAGVGVYRDKQNKEKRDAAYVKKYRKKHPESELSYTEIIRNRDKSAKKR